MKNLILIGAGAWALEVWSWIKHAKGYGIEFTFKGFLSNNLNEIDDKEYCNGRIIDVIDEYEPKVNDVFVCCMHADMCDGGTAFFIVKPKSLPTWTPCGGSFKARTFAFAWNGLLSQQTAPMRCLLPWIFGDGT